MYKKIGEIRKGKANIILCGIWGVCMTGLLALLSLYVQNFDLLHYVSKEKIGEILLIVPSVFAVFILHELIHVAFFLLFGKGEARIRVSREKAYGAVVMHQVNPNVYYNRIQMAIILISPLVLLTAGLWGIGNLIEMPYLIFVNVVLNALGSSIDLYVLLMILFRYEGNILINFDEKEIAMNIYRVP